MNIFRANNTVFDLNKKTLIMGIVNVTPDSFSDGGKYLEPEKATKRILEMQNLGADIVDIGGQSTRPGFSKISDEEEWKRLYPVLKNIKNKVKIPISIDTFYPNVAKKALDLGADIINDISGLENEEMLKVVSKSNCGIIIMHNKEDLNIKENFEFKLKKTKDYGISSERICFDPGIGFLQNRTYDRFVINNLNLFKIKGIALLIGLSRKRVISEFCGENPDNNSKLFATIAANTIAIQKGANILRVHDIKESIIAAKTADAILKTKNSR